MDYTFINATVTLFLFVGTMLIVITGFLMILNVATNSIETWKTIALLFMSICFYSVGLFGKYEASNILQSKLDAGYSVYFNGEEIDGNKIDFSKYEVSVDNEEEVIYVSSKNNHSTIFMPVPIVR